MYLFNYWLNSRSWDQLLVH